jgi:hypothetical protein
MPENKELNINKQYKIKLIDNLTVIEERFLSFNRDGTKKPIAYKVKSGDVVGWIHAELYDKFFKEV